MINPGCLYYLIGCLQLGEPGLYLWSISETCREVTVSFTLSRNTSQYTTRGVEILYLVFIHNQCVFMLQIFCIMYNDYLFIRNYLVFYLLTLLQCCLCSNNWITLHVWAVSLSLDYLFFSHCAPAT